MDARECLKDIFQNINSWLNFAEAKNIALIGFDIAMFTIINELFATITTCNSLVIFLFFGGLIFPLLSFFPLYRCKKFKPHKNNLLFFRDIAGYNSIQYLNELKTSYLKKYNVEDDKEILSNYAEEITSNSRITVYKLFMFKMGLSFSIILIIYVVILYVINLRG